MLHRRNLTRLGAHNTWYFVYLSISRHCRALENFLNYYLVK